MPLFLFAIDKCRDLTAPVENLILTAPPLPYRISFLGKQNEYFEFLWRQLYAY